jgi:hypothetical protein
VVVFGNKPHDFSVNLSNGKGVLHSAEWEVNQLNGEIFMELFGRASLDKNNVSIRDIGFLNS